MHPEATAALTSIAQRAARRKGLASHHRVLRRALAGVSVQIWKRAAAMIPTCLPRESPEEVALLFGDGYVSDSDVSDDDSTSFGESTDAGETADGTMANSDNDMSSVAAASGD